MKTGVSPIELSCRVVMRSVRSMSAPADLLGEVCAQALVG